MDTMYQFFGGILDGDTHVFDRERRLGDTLRVITRTVDPSKVICAVYRCYPRQRFCLVGYESRPVKTQSQLKQIVG